MLRNTVQSIYDAFNTNLPGQFYSMKEVTKFIHTAVYLGKYFSITYNAFSEYEIIKLF